jgi:hypothetical protein
MEKKAFIIFDFDTKGAISNIQEAKSQLDLLKQSQKDILAEEKKLLDSQKELEKQGKANSKEYEDNFLKLKKLSEQKIQENAQMKVYSDKLRENEKALADNKKMMQASAGSVEQMRRSLAMATTQWKNMTDMERESTDAGRKLSGQIKGLTEELKRQESAVGDNRRNVGNYKSVMDSLPGTLGNVSKGVTGFSAALKANPIGFIAGLVFSFMTNLKFLQPVLDTINVVMGSVNAAFDVLVERFKMILDLDIVGAFSGIGDAMSEAARAGAEYARVQKQIADAQQIQNIANAKTETQLTILLAQLKDKTKSDEERIALAEKIGQIEERNADRQAHILNETLYAEKEKVKALLKTRGVQIDNLKTTEQLLKAAQDSALQDESFTKLEEAQIAVQRAMTESLALTEKLEARKNALKEEIAERNGKREEKEQEERKKAAEKRKAEEEKELTAFKARIKAFNDERESDLKRQQIIEAKKAADLEQWREKRKVADMSEEERKAYLFSQEIQRLKDLGASEMEILRLQNEEKIRVMQELGQREVKEKELTEKAKQELEMATFMASVDLLDATGNLMEALGSQSEEAFEIMKQIDTASALIKGFLAVQKTLADPLLPFPSNVIAATAIGLTTAANVVKIQSVKPKFSEGGNIDGASHEMGGVPIEAEGGEVVINKQSSKKWWKELDFINRDMGGRGIRRPKFALGGNVGATDGGYNIRQISQPVSDMSRQNQMISNSVKEAVSSVNIVTRVTDIRRVDKADNFAKSISELR